MLTKSSWDPGWLTSSRRVTARDQLFRGDTWHTRDSAPTVHPGNRAAGMGEVIRCPAQLVRVCSPSTWSPELLGPGKGTKRRPNRVCAFVENLNLSGLDLGSARNTGPVPCRATWNLSSVDWESTHHVSRGKPSVAKTLRTHSSVICLQRSSLPIARLNK